MKKYLLPKKGNFYKANLHCHTNISDGQMTPEEVKNHYKSKGYSVVAYTDHSVLVPHNDLADKDFLPLNGCEMGITQQGVSNKALRKVCHLGLIALQPDNAEQIFLHRDYKEFIKNKDILVYDDSQENYDLTYSPENITKMMAEARDREFFVVYNHPSWSLENYNDYMNYHGMNAMEIYNHGSSRMGYCDYNEKEYDDMLRGGKRIFCVAADDNHSASDTFGGFVMIKAEKLEYETITKALVDGDFYASQGPLINKLWFEDGKIHIECSDAKSIVLNTSGRRAKKVQATDGNLNSAEFEVLPEDGYVRITITDDKGRKANTNAYFTDQIFSC